MIKLTLREKIIDAAFDLFAEKGYENTKIAEIIDKANSSKGGFYHHFNSKAEILEEITNIYMGRIEKSYEVMLEQTDNTTIELLNNVLQTINNYKKDQIQNWDKLKKLYAHKESNTIIRKMADDFEALIAKIYLRLLQKGKAEGLFDIAYPEPLAGLWSREIIRIYAIAPKIICSENKADYDDFIKLLEFIEETINNSLGFTEHQILIKEPTINYINKAKEHYSNVVHETS